MYLITGHIFTGNAFEKSALVEKLTKARLADCKREADCMVFDLKNLTYFDPEANAWKGLKLSDASIDK